MKKYFISIVFSLIMMGFGITGCGEKAEELHVAVVGGACANSAQVNLKKVQEYIMEACESYGSVNMIVADGKPFQSAEIDIPDQSKQGLSEKKQRDIAASQTEQMMCLLNECRAKSEEVDLLSAIDLGARALYASGDGRKEMVISHSGLTTEGILDFTQGCFGSSKAEDVTAYLKEEGAIPDLNGIHVIWVGLGDTVDPQPELSSKDKTYLMELWETILREGGAEIEFAQDLPMETKQDSTLPKVSIVTLLQPASAISEAMSDVEKAGDAMFILDEETVHFKPGSEELLSGENEVKTLLQEMILYMTSHPSYQILLAGTTASAGTQEELVELSEKRCNTIREIFIKSGVSEEQVKIIGLGYENHPYYVPDVDENGELIEEIAEKNRAVIILPLASEAAQALMNGI